MMLEEQLTLVRIYVNDPDKTGDFKEVILALCLHAIASQHAEHATILMLM
jgi:hypothetical protein